MRSLADIEVLYEDDDLLALNKPAGSQCPAPGTSRRKT